MSRWKAAAIHLSLSLLIGAIVLALLFGLWYPQPYFSASGGGQLTIILLGVDLVLGPLLTLIVFKSGKKSLRFDLGVIGLLQAAALIYGLHVIVEARPVFLVAAIDRFNIVAANEIDPEDLAKGRAPHFNTLSWTGPRLVAARLPEDQNRKTDMIFTGLGGKDLQNYPDLYVDYAEEIPTLLARAKPLNALRASHPQHVPVIDRWLSQQQRNAAEVVWLPVMARRASLTMLIDAKTGTPIEALPIDPW